MPDGIALPGVTYDATTPALHITELTVTNPAVTTEALRWSTGSRGPAAAAEDVHGADLTAYAERAIVIGAQAIASAGAAQDTFNLEQLVQDVGTRTAESTTQAVTATTKVVSDATKALQSASNEAKKALDEAGASARKAFGESVAAARAELHAQLGQLFGGEDPEVLARLRPLLENFGLGLAQRADAHTAELFDKATKSLNPDDPTSPLAKHRLQMEQQHADLTARLEKQHQELTRNVAELTTAVKVQQAAAQATVKLAKVTPLAGSTYEDKLHLLIESIAVGLGDEYIPTGHISGAISRSKKGDGVLTISGASARLVVEMTNSQRREWGDYLDEAERNRQAIASLGLVASVERNSGQAIRVLGPRRLVLAFDPEIDDASLLRTVVQLLRTSALAAVARQDDTGALEARERIEEALQVLPKVEKIRKAAGYIRKNADDIDREGDKLHTALSRLLLQAQTALSGTPLAVVEGPRADDATGAA